MKFSRALLKTKFKAASVHFSLSAVIFVNLAYLIYFVWYPQPFFSIDGGWQGMRIVAAVDLVLGPLLTFLIFDLGKSRREIVFDLFIIAVIQIGALAYGVVTTYLQRPVSLIIFDNIVVSATEKEYGDQIKSPDELRVYSDESIPIIFAEIPLKSEEIDKIRRIKREQNIAEHAQMHLYRPRAELPNALASRQGRYMNMIKANQSSQNFKEWLINNNQSEERVMVALFSGRYGWSWLVFDLDGNYMGYFE